MVRLLTPRLAVLLFLPATGDHAEGQPVSVANSGFEQPALADGVFVTSQPGWTGGYYDPLQPGVWIDQALSASDTGVWNPDAVDGFTAGAFAGENTGYALSTRNEDVGLAQVMNETLAPNTRYELRVRVGNSFYNESDLTAAARLELLAGGILLAAKSRSSPSAGAWAEHQLVYHSGSSPGQLGEAMEIRLIATAFSDGLGRSGYEVDFDEVSLEATPSPDPRTDLPIGNGSFEEPPLVDDDSESVQPAWTEGRYLPEDPDTWVVEPRIGATGTWNPDSFDGYPSGLVPDGNNAGYALTRPQYDAGIEQVLSSVLEPSTEYALKVRVGYPRTNPLPGAGFRIELRPGSELLVQSTGEAPAPGGWEEKEVRFVSVPAHTALGEPLAIRLVAVDHPDTRSYEVDFDDVRLTKQPAGVSSLRVTEIEPKGPNIILTWESRADQVYAIRYSTGLSGFVLLPGFDAISSEDDERPAEGGRFTVTIPDPLLTPENPERDGSLFLIVEELTP
ncbi:hypothetical protein [Haloferula sp.]|uniref:hypothetical protein n=1 Tax=Haloferula sp. TaxID=2497595 RepID=UPI003C765C64